MSELKTAFFVGAIGGMLAAPFILLIAWLPLRRKSEADEVTHAERVAVLRNTIIIVALVFLGISGAYLVFNEEGALPTEDSVFGVPGGMGDAPAVAVPALPADLAGLPQTQTLAGQEAMTAVGSMNPGGQFPVSGAVMATYGDGDEAVEVRVAVLPAPDMATANVDTLVQMFSGGQMLLGKAKEVQPGVYRTEGPETVNYFFAAGSQVWWVEASDPATAERGLEAARGIAG